MDNLAAYTMEQLWDEIMARTDAAVLLTQTMIDSNKEILDYFHHGGISALGLLDVAHTELRAEYRRKETEA